MNDTSLTVSHNAYMASAPQIDYAPIAHHQSEFSSPETGLVQATINDGRVTIQPIQGRQNHMSAASSRSFASGLGGTSGRKRVIMCYNCKDDLDAYDSNCDELNSAKVALMANLSHYGSDNLAESNTKSTSDSNIISYSKYINESQYNTVQNSTLPALQDDLILSVIEQLKTQVVNCTKINQDNQHVNELLTAELEKYKNQERFLKEQMNDIQASTSYEHSLEIETLKHTLSEHLKEKESLTQKITLLKNDFQKEESRNIDRELALKKQVKELNNIALGFQNPRYLKKAQQLKPKLYDGCVIEISKAIAVPDTKETLMLAEESRSKMIEKQNDPQMIEKPILNQLSTDFERQFVPQTESFAEQAFWSQYSVQTDESNLSGTTIVEVPKELPKVSMVNSCLNKLKFHLASFDMVVKERTTATAITEGTWGFEHTKACFCDDIIPFVKSLKEVFTSFDQCLINEVTEVQNVFTQMELTIEQHCKEKTKRDTWSSQESAPSFAELFEINNLKAQAQAKDTVILKLKEKLNSLNGDVKDRHVKRDVEEMETLNIELDHKHTQEEAATLTKSVESERLLSLLNTSLVYAYGVDLLTGFRGNNLYTLSIEDMMAFSPICLLSKASMTKSWLWHLRLSHLNFCTINHLARQGLVKGLSKLKFEKDYLCSACAMGKSTRKTHKPKSEDTNQEKLY
nr:integrase, catalytic region, zinc finger, CCHC-type, peptidase aspartic, catalytic [Tanacetum cinerariifolium]